MELLLILLGELRTQYRSASLAKRCHNHVVCLVAVQVIVPTNCIRSRLRAKTDWQVRSLNVRYGSFCDVSG